MKIKHRWMALVALLLLANLTGLSACAGNEIATPTAPATEPAATTSPETEPTLAEPDATDTVTPTDRPTETAAPAETPTEVPEETEIPTETVSPTQVPEAEFEAVIGLESVVEGLAAPLVLLPAGDDSGRLFIADQVGLVWVLSPEGEQSTQPFLDLRDRMVQLNAGYDERGLLGLAFHPDYADTGRFYVYYSAPLRDGGPAGWNHTSHLSEFSVSSEDPDLADPESERILLQVDQPQSNHNGGQIAFGPDGYLYVPLGDGGGANDVGQGHTDTMGNGQDRTNLLGSILRIDVDGGDPYGIPEDNPFVDDEGAEEIFAYGFRNPFRIGFDAGGDQQLFAGDVGQNLWEEVDIVTPSGNYGWNIREGSSCFDPAQPNDPPDSCADTGPRDEPLIAPILEYQNAAVGGPGIAVIGGTVYRGSALPQFEGRYIFGDWSTSFRQADGTIFVATPPADGEGTWPFEVVQISGRENGELGEFLLSFGQDADNELYILTTESAGPAGETGKVYRLVPPDGE